MWARRSESRGMGEPDTSGIMDYNDPYMIWYRENTRLFISPINLSQSTMTAGQLQLLTQIVSQIHKKSEQELRVMPREVSDNYRSLIIGFRDQSAQCLQQVGYGNLLQPIPEATQEEEVHLEDDSPLID